MAPCGSCPIGTGGLYRPKVRDDSRSRNGESLCGSSSWRASAAKLSEDAPPALLVSDECDEDIMLLAEDPERMQISLQINESAVAVVERLHVGVISNRKKILLLAVVHPSQQFFPAK